MKHIMIDLETMDYRPTAAIVSIGAVQFDIQTGEIGKKFYTNVDLQSCINAGLTLCASTIMWWMSQDKEAQKSLSDAPVSLSVALHSLEDWFTGLDYCEVWANSPSFDLNILNNAFSKFAMPLPWRYYNERDCRTLVSFNPGIKKSIVNDLAHDALSDCLYQIKYCVAIWNSIIK